VPVALEGADQTATLGFTDLASNGASATVGGIHVDLTPPTIAGTRAPLANAAGWNNTPVTVSFTCDDALSGAPTPPVLAGSIRPRDWRLFDT